MNPDNTQRIATSPPLKCCGFEDAPQMDWATGRVFWQKIQCSEDAFPGSQYCWWHQSKTTRPTGLKFQRTDLP